MMKIGYGARIAGSVFLFSAFLTLGGCGYKNDPVPPETVVPKAIDDLRYTLDESGVRLTWTFPNETVTGKNLDDISNFEVYRAVVPLADLCTNCPIPFGEPLEVPGGVTIENNRRAIASYESSLLRSGHKYFFKVASRNSWWAKSGDSNIVSFLWHVPTSPPANLAAKPGDSRITLSWNPVTTLIDGSPVDGDVTYQVMKSAGGKDFEALGEPTAATGLEDSLVINGQKYFYKVQSRLLYEGSVVEGGMSDEIASSPVDQTPPLPPTGVRAVQAGSAIKVFWNRSESSDVAGYRIYRRSADTRQPTLVGEVDASTTLFVDDKAPKNIRVYYSVAAIDEASPANESDLSREATIR